MARRQTSRYAEKEAVRACVRIASLYSEVMTKCNINQPHCENCGSTDPADLQGEDGYTDCCNECQSLDSRDCRNHHCEEE